MRSVRRRNGHCHRQGRTISSSGQYWGGRVVSFSRSAQSESCFVLERALSPGLWAESLSRQPRRSSVRPGRAVVEPPVAHRGQPRCGSTSEIPERSSPVLKSGLRALVLPDGGHAVRPNYAFERPGLPSARARVRRSRFLAPSARLRRRPPAAQRER